MPKFRTRRRIKRPPLPRPANGASICAPAQYLDGTRIPNTCQTAKSLARLYSARTNIPSAPVADPTKLWSYLQTTTPACHQNETCILKTAGPNMATEVLAPIQPKGWTSKMGHESTFWTSTDIRRVMTQYEEAYPTFSNIPPPYINYDTRLPNGQCVSPELCAFSLADFRQQGKTDICIIFNTDTYGGEGIHWIFVYINIPQHHVVFFDSLGDPPPKEINRFVSQLKKQEPRMKYTRICKPHQKLDGECGTYCVFGVLLLLTGKLHVSMVDDPIRSWKERIRFLTKQRLSDEYIWAYRYYVMQPSD